MTENNKVVYNGQTLIDLTQDDVTASDVRSGVYFHDSAGVRGQGTLTSTSVPTADTIAEWDSDSHMNSEDMTSQEVSDFVDSLNISTASLLDMFYPVGSYYETSDTSFDPNVAWGGTWVQETAGQVHVSAGTGYAVAGALTNMTDGGASTVTLGTTQIPAHTHGNKSLTGYFNIRKWGTTNGALVTQGSGIVTLANVTTTANAAATTSDAGAITRVTTDASHEHTSVGGGQAHNNMQPYIIVNRWHRTA